MNGMHKFLWFLMTTTIAAFALPGMAAKPPQAPQKSYSVEFLLPPTAPDGTANPSYTTGTDGQTVLNLPVTVTVYVKNESPPSTADFERELAEVPALRVGSRRRGLPARELHDRHHHQHRLCHEHLAADPGEGGVPGNAAGEQLCRPG